MSDATPPRQHLGPSPWRILTIVISVLVYAFLLLPIIVVLPLGFSSGSFLTYPMPGLSLRWYEELAHNYKWLLALKNSAIVGVCAAALSSVLGVSAALALASLPPKARALAYGLFIAPLVVPVIILAVALFLFFSKLGLTGSLAGMVLAHTIVGAPYVMISVNAALQNFDTTLVRAAKSLGASSWGAQRLVVFPIIKPAIVAGALFAFVVSFDEVVISLFLASPEQVTLPIRLFDGIRDELTPVVISAATIMLFVSVGGMICVEALRRRSAKARGLQES
ncbi:ABC transporter permease [Bosea sp. (in: a-proteobacteria)]|jgi:putative spermidine/putrescine transport system permease protein|uniref:ABC transporter permease n=1 Tax=Bosea sp. (in: a-proteobacteria) TaxID=1871050 RepID=UPI002DDCCE6E|nr:ABC transporter permease [Bosea sp. (in: a-proteobacteria)]HEV2510089.1 ABC transporter permease [Bosea sp. (in: a-proteobacteria)]